MIEMIPPVYPNELFYSWISRYNSINANKREKTSYLWFNKTRFFVPKIHYPYFLDNVSDILSDNLKLTSKYLIDKHSVIPFFKPFITKDEYYELEKSITKKDLISTKRRIHFNAYNENTIYYCKKCYNENLQKYGESYIDTIHQVSGNKICYKHLIKLDKFEIPANISSCEYVDINNYNLVFETDENLVTYEQINFSNDINLLFNSNLDKFDLTTTNEKYDVMFQKRGYKIKDGPIDRAKLVDDFYQYYSREFLEEINLSKSEDDEFSWLNYIGNQKHKYIHPNRHLLLIRFLFGSFFEFLIFNPSEEQLIIDEKLKQILLTSNITDILKNLSSWISIIVKNANRLGILDIFYYNIRHEMFNDKTIEKYKNKIETYLSERNNVNREQMITYFNLEFYMIEIIDKEWIDNILSDYDIKSKKGHSKKIKSDKIDWHIKDIDLSKKANWAINEIKNEEPINRITKTYIAKKIKYNLSDKCLKLLPITKQIIDDNVESLETFKKRKIKYVIKQMRDEDEKITLKIIYDKVYIKKDIQNYREFLLNELNNV